MVVNLLAMVTEIAGLVMVNASESDFVESFTDVAASVGALPGAGEGCWEACRSRSWP